MCIIKKLSATIDFISNFQQKVELSGLPFENKKAHLSIVDRQLRLDFQLTTKEALENNGYIFLDRFYVIDNNKEKYIAPAQNGVLNGTLNLGESDTELQNYHISIAQLMHEKWNEKEKYYYRFLLPIEKVFWDSDIRTIAYQVGRNWHSGLIPIKFPEGEIQMYPVHIGEQKYLAIESEMKCTYEIMQKYIYSISLSLGLVTSTIPFDYAYIIATGTENFTDDLICGFTQMRPTIKGQYQFFTTNMYSIKECLTRNHVDYAIKQLYDGETFKACLQDWIQIDEFEKIVLMLYGNEDLARATLILIESSTMSLDYQGAMCAVVLETICSALEDSNDKFYLSNDNWKTKVKPPFEELINSLRKEEIITEDHAANMRNKLNSFNTTSNKDKLSLPFSQRKYTLSKQEKDVIDSRNRFLHGHILGHCFEESFQEIMYASLELQKLCALLLFRESGFYGLIVNNAVLMGLKKAISAEEPVLV